MKTITTAFVIAFLTAGSGLDASAAKEKRRSKSMEFEEGLVEGMNMSASNFAGMTQKRKRDRKDHLYNRILNFDLERKETLQSARYAQ